MRAQSVHSSSAEQVGSARVARMQQPAFGGERLVVEVPSYRTASRVSRWGAGRGRGWARVQSVHSSSAEQVVRAYVAGMQQRQRQQQRAGNGGWRPVVGAGQRNGFMGVLAEAEIASRALMGVCAKKLLPT